MPRRELPDFSSPSVVELRSLYLVSNDRLVRETILEVIRLRTLFDEIDLYCEAIQRAWRGENLGTLVAMEKLRVLRQHERSRMGLLSPPGMK